MTRPLRLDRETIKHARLADGEITNVNHLLHFPFAFGDDFSGLKSHKLAELMFRLAQCVTETTNRLAADRPGRDAPFQKCFVRAGDRTVVIFIGCCAHAGESSPVDRRNFVDLRAAAPPFTVEHAGVLVRKPQFFERCFHVIRFNASTLQPSYLGLCRQYLRITSIASSITSAVISSAGRKRSEFSPERSVKTPRSKKPCQNSSRVLASGKSKARNRPRPRAAESSGSSRCKSRS